MRESRKRALVAFIRVLGILALLGSVVPFYHFFYGVAGLVFFWVLASLVSKWLEVEK